MRQLVRSTAYNWRNGVVILLNLSVTARLHVIPLQAVIPDHPESILDLITPIPSG